VSRITVIGLSDQPLQEAALAAIARAALVVGRRRELQAVAHLLPARATTVELGADVEAALDAIAGTPEHVVVLAAGDPGFFGIGRALARRFGAEEDPHGQRRAEAGHHGEIEVLPAPSPVAVAFGRISPPVGTPAGWALPEDQFDHRDGTIATVEVRALALAWLGPRLGDLVWDVGAGSGAVGVECARLGAAVIAVESDPERCRRIAANAMRHDVEVEVRQGRAPQVLRDLPDPDAVFVGGGGHLLTEIIRTAADRATRTVVVALGTAERIGPAQRALADSGLAVDGTALQAVRLSTLEGAPDQFPLEGAPDQFPLEGAPDQPASDPVFVLRGQRR